MSDKMSQQFRAQPHSVVFASSGDGDRSLFWRQRKETAMQLGAFSISLNVTDIATSRAFYEKLGFEVSGGDQAQGWLILRNGATILGLFGGFIERNTLTFNPGWDQTAEKVDPFTDVRELQKTLKERGVSFVEEADETTTGPAHFVIMDPDGNPILVDQHR
jgi:lactoylglutathione lyase